MSDSAAETLRAKGDEMKTTWWIRYNPHTIAQTGSYSAGLTTRYPHVTWDGFVVYYTLWQTG